MWDGWPTPPYGGGFDDIPVPESRRPLSTMCSQTADAIENSLGSADPDTVTMLRIAVWANRLAAEQFDHGLTTNQVQRAEAIMNHQQATLAAIAGDE